MKSRKQVRRIRNKSKKFRKMKKGGGERENRLLFNACRLGDMELAMSLVDRGADVEARENTIANWLFNEYQKTPHFL